MEMTGRGDPARTLALLWRTEPRPARGPRPGLDLDRVVAAAVDIADADGLTALSMRKVAERLGVGTMSLYTYVPGKAELLDLMVDAVYGEAVGSQPAPDGWRAALAQVARANWDLCRRHPWLLYVAVGRPLVGPNETAKYEHELRALDGVGLSEVEMDSALRAMLGLVHAAARAAVEKAELERQTGLTHAQWWQSQGPALAQVMDPDQFPTATRVGGAVGQALDAAFHPEHDFEFGLSCLLDGIHTLVERRRTGNQR